MDVSLSGRRVSSILLALLSLTLISCGDRYDLATARGQQARIDDANFHLSRGECNEADEAINPLYVSPYVTPEVRIIKASAQACYANYHLLTFASNIAGGSNTFQALAKSLSNSAGDGARTSMFNAVDILTRNGGTMSAWQRTQSENTYMLFLQLGVISAIIRNYGSPDSSGNQHTNLSYPAGNMTDVDACALAAAFSFITDSFNNSDLSDSDTKSLTSSLEATCVAAGLPSCSSLNRDRSVCNGVNGASVAAGQVATSVNNAW
jgi:hypothetical protein